MDQLNFFDYINNDTAVKGKAVSDDGAAIKEKINRRRRQILIHSCIYYRMNTNLITDVQFDTWAYELVDLQRKYPEIANQCIFAKAFDKFDGTTGFDLPLDDPWVIGISSQLIMYCNSNKFLL